MSAKALLPALVAAAALYFMASVREVLLPFLLSAALAFIANPIVNGLEARGWRRERVVVLLYLAGLAALFLGGYWVASAAVDGLDSLRTNYPRYLLELDKALNSVEASVFRVPFAAVLLQKLITSGQSHAGQIAASIPSLAVGLLPLFTLCFLVPFIAFFFMAGGPFLVQWCLDFLPSRQVETVLHIVSEVDESLGNYVRGILLEALAVGAATVVGLWIVGIPYAVQLGVLVAVANLVPYVGPVVGVIAGGLVAIIQFKSVSGILRVLIVFGGVKLFDDWVLQPVILRRAVEMHPVVILFSLMAGETLGGVVGMVFAVPVACVVKTALEIGWEWYRSEYHIRPVSIPSDSDRIPLV